MENIFRNIDSDAKCQLRHFTRRVWKGNDVKRFSEAISAKQYWYYLLLGLPFYMRAEPGPNSLP